MTISNLLWLSGYDIYKEIVFDHATGIDRHDGVLSRIRLHCLSDLHHIVIVTLREYTVTAAVRQFTDILVPFNCTCINPEQKYKKLKPQSGKNG